MSAPYQHIDVVAKVAPLDVVMTEEHAEAVRRERQTAESAPRLIRALQSIIDAERQCVNLDGTVQDRAMKYSATLTRITAMARDAIAEAGAA